MKEAWETFRELWKIKRFRAFLKLGLYFIFIVLVVAFVRAGTSSSPNPSIVSESTPYKDYNNYDFIYEIGDTEITGTMYQGKSIMYIDGKSYTYENDELIYQGEVVDQTFDEIELSKLLPKNLDYLVNQATYDSIVNYEDHKKETYILSGEIYRSYMKLDNNDTNDVVLHVVKENDLITEISFHDIKLTYNNIGKISGLNK